MHKQSLSKNDHYLLGLKSLLWLFFGWLGFLLALTGFFYAWIVWGFFVLAGLVLIYYLLKKKLSLLPSKELLGLSGFLLIAVICFSYFTTPTIFSGRDQGAIAEAAIRLAQNHTLNFSTPASKAFAQVYGQGRALNFPGFFYDNAGALSTQFPLVYIAWLASFYGVFGLMGLTIANAVALLWFLFVFYFLARHFLPARGSSVGLLFLATSVSVYWFPKYTLSENLALPLLWLGIFALVSFLKKQNKLNFLVLTASLILLIFTRIEGIAFCLVSLVIVLSQLPTRNYLKNIAKAKILAGLFFFILVLILNTIWELNFYKEIIKALLPNVVPTQTTNLLVDPASKSPDFYLLQLFNAYGMLSFFVLSLVTCVFYAWRKKFYLLIPFFVVAPTLIYFFDSHISADHPWMLRRFAFSLLPMAILYCTLTINELAKYLKNTKNKAILRFFPFFLGALLLLGNLPAFWHFAFFAENKELLPQIEQLSQHFENKDLILVDRLTTGDGWSMPTGPLSFLYNKNAVYFFNPNDLAKLDLKAFDKVYLLLPTSRNDFYLNSAIGSAMNPIDTFTFTTSQLNLEKVASHKPLSFPIQKTTTTPLTIFRVQ